MGYCLHPHCVGSNNNMRCNFPQEHSAVDNQSYMRTIISSPLHLT
nr:MAG TPA: hypothetical protein [Caudoviricetes sp.]